MEGGGVTEQDYDEFEMLLGEIPSATSVNPHPEESSHPNSSPVSEAISVAEEGGKSSPSSTYNNLFPSSQSVKHGSNEDFYSGLAFERPARMNSSKGPFDQKHESDGNLDGGEVNIKNEYKEPKMDIARDGSNLPDDQSLTCAFEQLSFTNGVAMEPTTPASVKYKALPNCAFLLEGQYPNSMSKLVSGFDSIGKVISPPSPSIRNGMNLVNPASDSYPSIRSTNLFDKLNGEMNSGERAKLLNLSIGELNRMKPGYFQPLEKFTGDLGEQQQNLHMPLAPEMHSFQVLSRVPVPGVEFPSSAFHQPYYMDGQSPYMHPQHLSQSHVMWRQMEEEKYCRMNQQCLYLQQHQNHGSEVHPIQASMDVVNGSLTRNPRQPYFDMPIAHHVEHASQDSYWSKNVVPRGFNQSDCTLMGSGLCHYYAQGFCGRGEGCPFAHGLAQTSGNGLTLPAILSLRDFQGVQVLDKGEKQNFPEKLLTRSHGLNSLKAIKPCSISGHEFLDHTSSNGRVLSNGHFHHHTVMNAGSFQLDGRSSSGCSLPDNADLLHTSRLQQQKYNSVDEVTGRIYLMAKDQHGCRFLQKKFTEGTLEDVQKIFVEIIGHIVELMTDPFGNYLVQKLLEVCNEDQRMHILHAITRKAGDLIKISCDMHGTRAVQKVIETLKTPEQSSVIVPSLKPGIVMLMKDVNGNHVAQRCLQYLMPEAREFLFDAATTHCIELATDRHGCCVLQKCLHYSDGEQKRCLMSEIISNALVLSQDPFGNYVVQYIIELGVPWATAKVLDQLDGNYGYLSMQKYSSNVVEKCIKFAEDHQRARIIQELINNSRLGQILQDPFGNYVIQSALAESKGTLHATFVEAIRPHVPALRSSPYGKKVLSSNRLKK